MSKALDLARYYSRRENLAAFCHDMLRIKLEEGGTGALELNSTQFDLDHRLNQQLAHFGKVRAIILKPRREGMSTYIGARFYHRTIFGDGLNTYILTHKQDATDTLFKMVKLFQDNLPDWLRPSTAEDSAKSLSFPMNNASYALGTAGGQGVGRSALAHLFHASEVAYWRNADEVASSAFEIVGDKPNTEIILESTGAPGTYFEEVWERAVAGKSEYMPIFYPWYRSQRNVADASGLIPTDEERELMAIYPDMTLENIAFRRRKLSTQSEAKFRREYPAMPADAFMQDSAEAFIKPETVQKAINRKLEPYPDAVTVLGIDPSNTGHGDSVGMVVRQGNSIVRVAEFRRETVQERADVIRKFMLEAKADHTFIDQGGSGKEIYELLTAWGMPRSALTLVPFGASASNKTLYPNKRVEMYSALRNWLDEEGDIPNNPVLASELSLTKSKINNDGQEVLESKKEMRKSPNLADAAALTFAYPVMKRTTKVSKYR